MLPSNNNLSDLVDVPSLPAPTMEADEELSFCLPGLESLSVEFTGSLSQEGGLSLLLVGTRCSYNQIN